MPKIYLVIVFQIPWEDEHGISFHIEDGEIVDKLSYSGMKQTIEPALGRTLTVEERGCNSKAIQLNQNALKEARMLSKK